jgi:hypothetical protein
MTSDRSGVKSGLTNLTSRLSDMSGPQGILNTSPGELEHLASGVGGLVSNTYMMQSHKQNLNCANYLPAVLRS